MRNILITVLLLVGTTIVLVGQTNYTKPERNITSFGGVGDGISPNDAALQKAWQVTDILVINKTKKDSIYRINKHRIPAGKTLVFERGAMFDVRNDLVPNQTQIIAGAHQIFTVNSQVYMGQDPFKQSGRDVNLWIYEVAHVEWFGADPTGVKPSGKAFNKTMRVFVDRVRALGNYYLIDQQLKPPYMVDLSGGPNTHLYIDEKMNDDLFYITRDHKSISNFIIPIPVYTQRPCADGNCRDTTEADAWNHWVFNMDLHYPQGKVYYDYEASRLPTYIQNISSYQSGQYTKKLSGSKNKGKCLDKPSVRPKFMRIVPSKNIKKIRENDTLYDGIQNLAKNVNNCFTKGFDTVLFVQGEPERFEGDRSMVQSHAHRFVNFYNSGTTGGIVLKENVAQYVFTGLHMSNESNSTKCKHPWYQLQTGITLINTKGVLMYGTFMDAHSDTIVKIVGSSNGNYIQMTNNNLGNKTYMDLNSPHQANNAVGAKDSYWLPTAYGLVPTKFNRGKRFFFGNPPNISKIKQYVNIYGDVQLQGINEKFFKKDKIKVDVKSGGNLASGKYEYRLFLESRDQFDFVFGYSDPIVLGEVDVSTSNAKVRVQLPEYPTQLVSHYALYRKDSKGNFKYVGDTPNNPGAVIVDNISTDALTAAKRRQHPKRNENYGSLGKAIWIDGDYFIRKLNNSYLLGSGRENLWTTNNSLVFGDKAANSAKEISNSVIIGHGVQSATKKIKNEMHIGNPNGEWLAGDKAYNVSTPNGNIQTHAIQLGDTSGLAPHIKGEGWAYYDGEHFRDQYKDVFRRRDLVEQANHNYGSTSYVFDSGDAYIKVNPSTKNLKNEMTLLIKSSFSSIQNESVLFDIRFSGGKEIQVIETPEEQFKLVFNDGVNTVSIFSFEESIPVDVDLVWGFTIDTDHISLYKNGVKVEEQPLASFEFENIEFIGIGGSENNSGKSFTGLMGDVLCFNVHLTEEEMNMISQNFYSIPEKYLELTDDKSESLMFWLGAEKSTTLWKDYLGKSNGEVFGMLDITHKTKYIRTDKIKTKNLEDNGNEIVMSSDVQLNGTQQLNGGLQVKAVRYTSGTTLSGSDVYIYLHPDDHETFYLPKSEQCVGSVFYLLNETDYDLVLSPADEDLINSNKQAVVVPAHASLTIHNTGLEGLGWAVHGLNVMPQSPLLTGK